MPQNLELPNNEDLPDPFEIKPKTQNRENQSITPEIQDLFPGQPQTINIADMLNKEVDSEETMSIEREKPLRPANKIFFHATPTQNTYSLIQQGIISTKNQDTIGRDLMYSLTFDKEFNDTLTGRLISIIDPPSDFTLTIWRNSQDIKQIKGREGKLKIGQFGTAGSLNPEDKIPSKYLESRGGGRWKSQTDKADLRKVGPSDFLASIPINESTQIFLTKCRMEFAYNLATADEVEQRMLKFFSNPDNQIHFGQNYSAANLAHDLTARIEQEVLLNLTGQVAKNAINNIRRTNPLIHIIQAELEELETKASTVNEPVSQRYVAAWITRCQKALEKYGIKLTSSEDKTTGSKRRFLKREEIDIYKLWGGNDGYSLARRVAFQLGIEDF